MFKRFLEERSAALLVMRDMSSVLNFLCQMYAKQVPTQTNASVSLSIILTTVSDKEISLKAKHCFDSNRFRFSDAAD